MVTKAVHLDLAVGLTTEEFMEAFARFISRKGRCIELWSDTGTTFKGTLKELQRVLQEWYKTIPAQQLSKMGTSGVKSIIVSRTSRKSLEIVY